MIFDDVANVKKSVIPFRSVPFRLGYKEPLTNNISIQQILVPFRLGYEIWRALNISTERSEKFVDTNNVSIQQISCSVPFNKEAWTNNISIQQIYRTAKKL